MSSVIACAKTAAASLLAGYLGIRIFTFLLGLALVGGHGSALDFGVLWINHIATVFIGLTAGLFGAHFDRRNPLLTAAVAATLVQLLNLSIGAGLRDGSLLRNVSMTVVAAGIAALLAWWRSRRGRSAPHPAIQRE
jgi:hypothetical protein